MTGRFTSFHIRMGSAFDRREQEGPNYLSLLTSDDKRGYESLREAIDPLAARTIRSLLGEKFQEIVGRIRDYAIRGDSNDWKRCLVCGVAWLDDSLAISTRQLCKLIGKCKSSINSGLQAIGYETVPLSPEHARSLVGVFPFMRDRVDEMRQWTIRGHMAGTAALTLASPKTAAVEADQEAAALFPGSEIEDWMLGDDCLIFNLE
jgi:hypothetical protein